MSLPENYPAGLRRHLYHFASLLTVCPQPTTDNTASALPGAPATHRPSLQDFFPGLVVLSTLAALPDWKLASTPYEAGDGLWVATLDISDPESRKPVFRLTASYGDDKSQRTLRYQFAPHKVDAPVEILGAAFPNRGVLTGWLTACVERVVAETRAEEATADRSRLTLLSIVQAKQMAALAQTMMRVVSPEFTRWSDTVEYYRYIHNRLDDLVEHIPAVAEAHAMARQGEEDAEIHLSELAKALTQIKVADRTLYWDYNGNHAPTCANSHPIYKAEPRLGNAAPPAAGE